MGKESLDPKAVTKEIYIECSRETLFPFFLEPQKMAQWMGNQILLEPRIGGALRIDFNGTDMVSGHYREVEPPGRIVFSWGWIGSATCPPGSSTVEIVLLEQGEGTRLVLTHAGLPDSRRPTHRAGWDYYLGRLQLILQGIEPGPDTFAGPSPDLKED